MASTGGSAAPSSIGSGAGGASSANSTSGGGNAAATGAECTNSATIAGSGDAGE